MRASLGRVEYERIADEDSGFSDRSLARCCRRRNGDAQRVLRIGVLRLRGGVASVGLRDWCFWVAEGSGGYENWGDASYHAWNQCLHQLVGPL